MKKYAMKTCHVTCQIQSFLVTKTQIRAAESIVNLFLARKTKAAL